MVVDTEEEAAPSVRPPRTGPTRLAVRPFLDIDPRRLSAVRWVGILQGGVSAVYITVLVYIRALSIDRRFESNSGIVRRCTGTLQDTRRCTRSVYPILQGDHSCLTFSSRS